MGRTWPILLEYTAGNGESVLVTAYIRSKEIQSTNLEPFRSTTLLIGSIYFIKALQK
jgi:hypothetical protein